MFRKIIIDGKNLTQHKKEKSLVCKLLKIFENEKSRCNNKNHNYYKLYGAKGIQVEYSFIELWTWFEKEFPKYKGKIEELNIGRIDHFKNYTLDNIGIITKGENSREARIRNGFMGNPIRKVMISSFKTGRNLCIAESCSDTAYLSGVNVSRISCIAGKRPVQNGKKHIPKQSKGYSFRFI